jgi:Mg2+-importing ATPase
VPADGVVLAANAAQVNQAALTGEPYPVEKTPTLTPDAGLGEARTCCSGSSMVGGTARMLVVETGGRTRFGAIAASARRAGKHRL